MIRLGSAISILVLWMIFSRDITGVGTPVVWYILALHSIVIYPIYTLGYYYAVKHLPLSYFGMLGIVAPVANTFFSYLFFDTIPTLAGYVGISSILFGLAILLYKHEDKTICILPFIVAIAVYVSMGFNPILDRIAMLHVSPFTYAMFNQTAAIIPIFLMSFLLSWGPQVDFFRKNIPVIAVIGLTQGIGWLGGAYAFAHAPNVGYAVALINTHAILTALYGIFILKEELTKRKIFVFFCMLVALISFAFA
jgi:drug/metabolite transporter (DMT)-like permease